MNYLLILTLVLSGNLLMGMVAIDYNSDNYDSDNLDYMLLKQEFEGTWLNKLPPVLLEYLKCHIIRICPDGFKNYLPPKHYALSDHTTTVHSHCFRRDGGKVLINDGSVGLLWNLNEKPCLPPLRLTKGEHPISKLSLTPCGTRAAIAHTRMSHNGYLVLCDLRSSTPQRQPLDRYNGPVVAFCMARNGNSLLVGGDDQALCWDIGNLSAIRQFSPLLASGKVKSVGLSDLGQHAILGSDRITFCNPHNPSVLPSVLDSHGAPLSSVLISSDGECALTASIAQQNSNMFWKLAGGVPTSNIALEPLVWQVEKIVATPDCKCALTVDSIPIIRLWHFEESPPRFIRLKAPAGEVISLCITPNARWAVAVMKCDQEPSILVLWNLPSQNETLEDVRSPKYHILPNPSFDYHKNIRSVSISDDGRWVVTGAVAANNNRLCTAILWDLLPPQSMIYQDLIYKNEDSLSKNQKSLNLRFFHMLLSGELFENYQNVSAAVPVVDRVSAAILKAVRGVTPLAAAIPATIADELSEMQIAEMKRLESKLDGIHVFIDFSGLWNDICDYKKCESDRFNERVRLEFNLLKKTFCEKMFTVLETSQKKDLPIFKEFFKTLRDDPDLDPAMVGRLDDQIRRL